VVNESSINHWVIPCHESVNRERTITTFIDALTDTTNKHAQDEQMKTVGMTGFVFHMILLSLRSNTESKKTELELVVYQNVPNGNYRMANGLNVIVGD
jgi:hydrogenase maturation factor HypF (carbamoyltransferase family)